ncbi:MAG: 4Fe-4S binding protein [Ruminococcaceae bacterium]|nr:4Fe-4S binding protein [Oscillospiraceae bacterium]
MSKVNIKINNVDYQVEDGITVLEACHQVGIRIPTLCWMREMNEIGACRICVVEVKGARTLVTACVYPVNDGMEIVTNSDHVQRARKTNLELLLSTHDQNCLSCIRSTDCELQTLCQEYGVDGMHFIGNRPRFELETSTLHMVRDNNKCILCRRCVAACQQQVSVIEPSERGFETHIACAFEAPLGETACISCGQCIVNCPTGALVEKDDTDKVRAALSDPTKTVIVHTAPSIRATLGESFGMPVGTNVEGKMAAALRRLGFDKVFDTDFAADLTIMEEGTEFVTRVKNGGTLPLLTSCCPGWSKYCEINHPDLFDNISSCKSPQGMQGAMIKTYWAEKNGVKPEDIVVVSIMPCTAKKFELDRYDMEAAGEGIADNDFSLTTRELARMIQRAGLDFASLPEEEFDPALGESTGAAVIFGASGGVLEAALRTAVEVLTGEELPALDFTEVRGTEGAREATYKVGDMDVNVCAVSGLANVEKILRQVKAGEKNYHIIEIMACPGGCINGGGQPSQPASIRNWVDLKGLRAGALYSDDAAKKLRKSHDNPLIKEIYANYLGAPNSEKAHHILHTSYKVRTPKY